MKKNLYYFFKSAGKMLLDVILGVLSFFAILGLICFFSFVLIKIFNV